MMERVTSVIPTNLPHGRTARRLEWEHLPPLLRAEIEKRLGSRVVETSSRGGGYMPGLASAVTCQDGSRHFLKAASAKAQRASAAAYREEAVKHKKLAGWIPSPKMRWSIDGDWVVLCFEYAEGRPPERPWTSADLSAVSDALVLAAESLTPAPGLGWASFAEEHGDMPALWESIPERPHAEEAAALAAGFAEHTAGDTLLHLDVRDDNILIRPDGGVWLVDWNWPVLGAAWLDSLQLLIGPRGDGFDSEAFIGTHPLLSKVEPEAIDSVLALFAGYFLERSAQPRPSSSPYLREVQRWQGEVCWAWLCERRGW